VIDSTKNRAMPIAALPAEKTVLEEDRESFLRSADALVPESVRILLREVEKFAPPPVTSDDSVTVTVHGSWDANAEPNPE
jgi:hypothetical protein